MAGENSTAIPNFFILLDLNPDDPWDERVFEQRLAAKRKEWTNNIGFPNAAVRLAAKQNLSLITVIQETMAKEELRNAQAATARIELVANNKSKIEHFEQQLRIAAGKGFLEKAEVDKFIDDFKDVLSEQEIRSRIKVKIVAPTDASNKDSQPLDPIIIKDISDNLQFLQMKDLYELFGMKDRTSNEVLCRAAQDLYQEMIRRQPKSAEVDAKQKLAGRATTIFKSPDMRQKYDDYLKLKSLTALLQEFDKTVSLSGKEKQKGLYAGQVAIFFERAAIAGWSQEEARVRLSEYAKKRNWFLEVPTLDMKEQKQRCGYCNEMNEKGREYCVKCNKELSVTCPNCGRRAPSDEIGCGGCGFPVGNRFFVDELLDECQDLLSQHAFTKAEEKLKLIEEAWHPKKSDARCQRIQQCREEIQRAIEEQQRIVQQLKQYMNARQFLTAREYLVNQGRDSVPDKESYLRTITTEITQAQDLLKRAKVSGVSIDQKIDFCMQALRVCVDYKEARDLLSTAPPSAPRNLQAKVGGSTISLQWEPSATRHVSYKVVRKVRSQPVSVKDGQLLETVTGYVFDDTQPEIGMPMFYAVFAALQDVVSTAAATLSQPVMLTGDATEISLTVNDHFVDLSWHAPPNVQNVVVVRKEKTLPGSMNDGKHLIPLDFGHLVDRDVENSRLYFYSIYCQFKDFHGRIVTSAGVTQQATPEPPPAAVTAMEVETVRVAQGYEVKLRWVPPNKGRAVVLKSERPPELKHGDTLRKATLDQYGAMLEERPDSVSDLWSQPGIAYYTPLVIFQEMAYVGTPQRVVVIDDVSNLRCQNLGTAIRLLWTWPANCQEALVSYNYDGWPQPHSLTANTQRVTRAEYDYQGHYDIKSAQDRDHYIVVAAVIKQGNVSIAGAGLRVQARLASRIAVTYEIKTARNLFGPKKHLLHISSRTSGTLPTLLLILKQGRLPTRKAEGEPFHRLEGPIPIVNDLEFELPERAFAPKTFGKLYLEDDSRYDEVTIHHPGEEKLRLS